VHGFASGFAVTFQFFIVLQFLHHFSIIFAAMSLTSLASPASSFRSAFASLVVSLLILSLAMPKAQAQSQPQPTNALAMRGFSEVIVSVHNLPEALKLYQDIGGYEIVHFSDAKPEQTALWGLPVGQRIEECLLRPRADKNVGGIRLVKFHDAKNQRQIRSSAQSWEPGGIFDMRVRVRELKPKFAALQHRSWHGFADPLRSKQGGFDLQEVVMRGHDGVVLTLQERLPLDIVSQKTLKEFSAVYASSQVVTNLDAAVEFYTKKLGFTLLSRSDERNNERKDEKNNGNGKKTTSSKSNDNLGTATAPNLFGVPSGVLSTAKRRVALVHPQAGGGVNEGAVELVQYEGLTASTSIAPAATIAQHAVAPNVGLLALRFPVGDMKLFKERLQRNGVSILREQRYTLEPYGAVESVLLKTSDGALLEFLTIKPVLD
jgi:catechol 2,3-dioxygenase-like lactoylglutathione lyase family enzyme